MPMFEVLGKHAIYLDENLVEFQVHGGKRVQIGTGKGHDQGGAKAGSFDVAHGDFQVTIRMAMKSK
jgi:hypothetical protein